MADAQQIAGVIGLGQIAQNNQAAQQAAQQYQNGDIKGAYTTMIKANPEWAAKMVPDLTKIDPDLAAMAVGKAESAQQNALNQAGNGAAQVATIGANGRIAAAEARAQALQDQLVRYQTANGQTAFAKKSDIINQSNAQGGGSVVPGGQSMTEIGSDGKPVEITRQNQKDLIGAAKDFNKYVDPEVKAINSAGMSEDITKANVPGAKVAEKVNTLRALYGSGRVPQQLIDQYMGSDAGLVTDIQDKLSEKAGDGLGPQLRQKIYQLNQAILQTQLSQYDAKLRSYSQTVANNLHLDPFVVKRHLAAEGPTPVQQTLAQVAKMPPQDQAAFNQAHDDLFSPDQDKVNTAKQVLQFMQKKYGVHL